MENSFGLGSGSGKWSVGGEHRIGQRSRNETPRAVFGNSRQFFIMRQNDRADLDDMGSDIALPEVTQHAIMNYPLPDHQTGQKYSPFTYLHTDATRNLCGTVHNVASPEMLYCSSSSGEHFDRRARELRQSPSVVEGIILHANRRNDGRNQSSLTVMKNKLITNATKLPFLILVAGLFAGCAANLQID
jgi:hypothetical protein